MENIHFAIKNNGLLPKSKLLKNILIGKHSFTHLKDKKGLLFSGSILNDFIKKEAKYDIKTLAFNENRNVKSFSSGEQKKALLNYLIAQKPDFLILDSPFESLDVTSVVAFKKKLVELSKQINLIQVFNRKEEILPAITHVLETKSDEIIACIPIHKYKFKDNVFKFEGKIPKAITLYKNIPKQLVSLQNVSVIYNEKTILNNINWVIKSNEFWQLIGPNGSGKTTILSMIYGDNVKAYGQEIYLFGNKKGSGESVWEIKEKIGYFSPSILELFNRKHTVKQMILSGFFDSIGLYQTPSTLQISIAENWISLLDLKTKENTSFIDVSVATQRLILIARAMIKHPPLLILDEPLINLNDQETQIIVSLINKIAQESNTTVLFVSHRNVKNLQPNFTYQLTPTENGSIGNVLK